MARMVLSKEWCAAFEQRAYNGDVDETQSFLPALQFAIKVLVKTDRPFKIFNLGAGVKRITTKTNTCPCCRREL